MASSPCGIKNEKSKIFPLLPCFQTQLPGYMQQGAAAIFQKIGEVFVPSPKDQPLDPAVAISILKNDTQCVAILPDPIGLHAADIPYGQQGFLIARPKGGQQGDLLGQCGGSPPDGDDTIQQQVILGGEVTGLIKGFIQSGMEGGAVFFFYGESCRHGVSSPRQEQAGLMGLDDGCSDIQTRDGTGRAFHHTILQGTDQSRTVESFLQPPGHDANHTGVPVITMQENDRMTGLNLFPGLLDSGIQNVAFHGLAFAVDVIQLFSNGLCFMLGLAEEQPQAVISPGNASTSIDARPKGEAAAHGAGIGLDPGHIGQGGQPDPFTAVHDLQPLCHKSTVEALQRHDIADGGQSSEVQQGHGVWGVMGFKPSLLAQGALEGHDCQEGNGRGAEMAQTGLAVQPVRIHDQPFGQAPSIRFVMIQNDPVGLPFKMVQNINGRCAAVHADKQAGALIQQGLQRRNIGAIPFSQPVGDVGDDMAAQSRECGAEQRRTTGPIHVIIAQNAYGCPSLYGSCQPQGCGIHVPQDGGVGQGITQAGPQIGFHHSSRNAPPGQNAGSQFGDVHLLGEGQRKPVVRFSQDRMPPDPAAQPRTALDIQDKGGSDPGIRFWLGRRLEHKGGGVAQTLWGSKWW